MQELQAYDFPKFLLLSFHLESLPEVFKDFPCVFQDILSLLEFLVVVLFLTESQVAEIYFYALMLF